MQTTGTNILNQSHKGTQSPHILDPHTEMVSTGPDHHYTSAPTTYMQQQVDCVWNVTANTQKPDFIFSVKQTSPFQ